VEAVAPERWRTRLSVVIRYLVLAFCLIGSALCAPTSSVAATFDHSHAAFGNVLRECVRDGLVDYASLRAKPESLKAYLDELARVPEKQFMKFSEPEKIAFLLNLYNASTLQLVIDYYPIAGIKEIGNWLNGPFDQKVVRFADRKFGLGDIEHGVLRRNHNEPRIHFALVCAARSCPKLRAEPYTGAQLEAQLTEQTREFLSDKERGNSIDTKSRTLVLSKIFKWYEKDFTRKADSVTSFILPFLPPSDAAAIRAGGYQIIHADYDWSLNAQGSIPNRSR
jgi:hypothetical protein